MTSPTLKVAAGCLNHSFFLRTQRYGSDPPSNCKSTQIVKDEEMELDGQTAEDEDTQLPLLPPVHTAPVRPPIFLSRKHARRTPKQLRTRNGGR